MEYRCERSSVILITYENWAGEINDKKSVFGHVMKVFGTLKLTGVSLSSTKAANLAA